MSVYIYICMHHVYIVSVAYDLFLPRCDVLDVCVCVCVCVRVRVGMYVDVVLVKMF